MGSTQQSGPQVRIDLRGLADQDASLCRLCVGQHDVQAGLSGTRFRGGHRGLGPQIRPVAPVCPWDDALVVRNNE
jgi:hypothetical protein